MMHVITPISGSVPRHLMSGVDKLAEENAISGSQPPQYVLEGYLITKSLVR